MQQDNELVLFEHEQWLRNPVTRESARILARHKENIINALSSSCMDEQVSDSKIRNMAVQLQTTKLIEQLLYDSKRFIEKSNTR